ncbi:OpgC domain-containing protein [Thioclava sp. GXIMD4216]|uniref:OpgC domain-containing protein n=1 Tax=Thioclava litoralis TaxID=3076557 RepID=A0ABZ1E427_9RHOB|nr:OpgC domain-containing protein [Thioclava sp. FTW29]
MPEARSARDPRLDFFRGIALAMIFVNHIPHQIYENFTSRNFGHSDAAEGFVFMSGLAAALAYGPKLAEGFNRQSFGKIWGRSWTLYMTHLVITFWVIAIFAGGALFFGGDKLLTMNAFGPLAKQPLEWLIGLATLSHQLGYVNILPMYAALMIAAPFMIRFSQVAPMKLLAVSLSLWALAGTFRLNFPNFPYEGGWFFNPLSWQLIFCIGILTGTAMRGGKRFLGVHKPLVILAGLWLVMAAIWVNNAWMLRTWGPALGSLKDHGVPFFLVTFDKTFLSLPRFLHVLALVYILSMPYLVPQIAASKAAAPLRMLGRHGLKVFAFGTVLAIFAQAVKVVHPGGLLQDTVLVWGGLAILYAIARISEWMRAKPVARDVPAARTMPREDMPGDLLRPGAPALALPRLSLPSSIPVVQPEVPRRAEH